MDKIPLSDGDIQAVMFRHGRFLYIGSPLDRLFCVVAASLFEHTRRFVSSGVLERARHYKRSRPFGAFYRPRGQSAHVRCQTL